MADLTDEQRASYTKITGGDELYTADVVLIDGERRLRTDTLISAQVSQGRDPIPDSWFRIVNTGAEGDQLTIDIAATVADPSSPDRDLPAFSKTFTVLAGEVGDEITFGKRIVTEIKADAGALSSEITAQFVKDDANAVVFVSSRKQGEFFERSSAGDFDVTTTGTMSVTIGFDNFVQRAKESELARSTKDPRKGVLGISGSVVSSVEDVELLLEEFATDGASNIDLAVNGSVTPVVYTIDANAVGGNNKVITAIKLYGTDVAIKVGESNFMGLNSALTNGILIEITKESITSTFRNIKSTNDMLGRMASSPEKGTIISQAGGDYINTTFDFGDRGSRLTLEAGTTDQIKVTIRDNVNVDDLFFVVDGFEEDS